MTGRSSVSRGWKRYVRQLPGLKPGLFSGRHAGLKAALLPGLAARGRKQNRLGWREDWGFPHLAKPGGYGAPGSGQPVLRWTLGEISRAGHHAPGDHCAGQGERCADHHHDAKSKDKPLPNGSGYGGHGGRIETGRRLKSGEPVLLRADLLQRGRWQGELHQGRIEMGSEGPDHRDSEDGDAQHSSYSRHGVVDAGCCAGVVLIDGVHHVGGQRSYRDRHAKPQDHHRREETHPVPPSGQKEGQTEGSPTRR